MTSWCLLGLALPCAAARVVFDTGAMQYAMTAVQDPQDPFLSTVLPEDRSKPLLLKENHTIVWIEGPSNTNGCPDGAVPISEDECRAVKLMASPNHVSQAVLNPEWPLGPMLSTMYPGGCSTMSLFPASIISWNSAPGAANMAVKPICKEDYYTLWAGGKCPDNLVSLSEDECNVAAHDFHYHWVSINPITDAGKPVGCFGKDGDVYFNGHPTGTSGDQNAFNLCKKAGVTTSHAPTEPLSKAMGDPHMTTVTGSRFDILHPGNYTFLHVPQGAAHEDTLLSVRAYVKHEGLSCLDMYISALSITGKWADDLQFGGFRFSTDDRRLAFSEWTQFGRVDLKVVHGATAGGQTYLNLLARRLTKVGLPIGGILGFDDHTAASTPDDDCKKKITLLSYAD